MFPGNLMIRVERQGGVGESGMGQSQRSLSGSMMLYEGAAPDVVGVLIHFVLWRGCRSCGTIVGTPGGQTRRVCSKLLGWGWGWVVHGRDKGITDGGGWFGAWNGCRHCVGGVGAVAGVAVGMR
jgi:hypothetical protein